MYIYIKKHISNALKAVKTSSSCVDRNLFFNLTENLKLCVLYVPPASFSYCKKCIFDEIPNDLLTYWSTNSPTALLGDFNARTAELLDYMKDDNCNKTPKHEAISLTKAKQL